jgi:uncharacterized phage-like protein YoqJ
VSCAKQSEEYRVIADAVRQKTAEIPLWDEKAAQKLAAEKHQACFFTGHREIIGHGDKDAESFQRALREWLEHQVEAMIYQGFSTFYCGGARGFDLLAAAAVLQAKQLYHPELHLVLLLPCREQTRGWNARDLALHLAVLQRAEAYYMQEDYDRSCMHRRNRLMAELSIAGIAYYDPAKERSGTGMTVRYAQSLGMPMLFMPLDGGDSG